MSDLLRALYTTTPRFDRGVQSARIDGPPDVFGRRSIFDEKGGLVGWTESGPSGESVFDADGTLTGRMDEGALGEVMYTDAHGGLVGTSSESALGGETFRDAVGNLEGYTTGGSLGTENIYSADGTHIGTAVDAEGVDALAEIGPVDGFEGLDVDVSAFDIPGFDPDAFAGLDLGLDFF